MLNKSTIKSLLEDIDAKIEHIEDITADNRATIIKLVKQSNQIVAFLKDLELEVVENYDELELPTLTVEEQKNINRFKQVKETLDEFIDKREELKEFEEELKKHKGQITPGQIGES